MATQIFIYKETDNVDKDPIDNLNSSTDYLFDQDISEIKPLKAGEIKGRVLINFLFSDINIFFLI